MSKVMPALFLTIGSIIIDDIILPDGRRKLGILGGGLTHAAMGMRVWSDRVGLVSSVGGDFDPELMRMLETYFEVSGVRIDSQVPTPRAWQVFDEDGTRHETFQTDFFQMQACIPKPDNLVLDFDEVSGVHLHCPANEVEEWVTALRDLGCRIILWEPWDGFCVPENEDLFKQNSALVEIVSPNLREGRILTGLDAAEDVIFRLKEYGGNIVVVRMAEEGSLVVDQQGFLSHIPAFPVQDIVDVTGAGNAFCGGYVCGYVKTGDARTAGYYGGVSASLALHQFGALYSLDQLEQEAEKRLKCYQQFRRKF